VERLFLKVKDYSRRSFYQQRQTSASCVLWLVGNCEQIDWDVCHSGDTYHYLDYTSRRIHGRFVQPAQPKRAGTIHDKK